MLGGTVTVGAQVSRWLDRILPSMCLLEFGDYGKLKKPAFGAVRNATIHA
jgi:hypothetical protein